MRPASTAAVPALMTCLLLLTAAAATAHEVKLADGRAADYTGLKAPGGALCCGGTDCRPTEGRWTFDDRFVVLTDLEHQVWREVPRDKIIMSLPEQLRGAADVTHACWRGPASRPHFYCVFPAAQGS